MRFTLLFALCLTFVSEINAQSRTRPAELGNPDLSWWTESLSALDTMSDAVILFDHGKCIPDRYGTRFIKERRFKILKNNAFKEWGNLSFTTYEARISDFECTVYNLENGKIVATSIDKSDFLKKQKNDEVKTFSVAIPNLKVGSVVEYTYTMNMPSLVIPQWSAQQSIPVLWSEYEVGFGTITRGVTATVNGIYTLSDVDKSKGAWRKYIFRDLPAFIPEPFMPSHKYYQTSIEFRPTYKRGPIIEEYRVENLSEFGLTRDSLKMDTKLAVQVNLKVTLSNELQGNVTIRKSGYDAFKARESLKELSNEDYLKEELDAKNWTVSKQELLNKEDSTKELIIRSDLSIQDQVQEGNKTLYINPFVILKEVSNPLKLEKRIYPLDLGSRMVHIMTTVIEIPQGYKVDELPKNLVIGLPGKDASFYSNASVIGNSIYITSQFKTNKIIFAPMEYPALREFYDRMIAKKNEQIVLKKN